MSGSIGFVLRDNVEITSVNRPEGRIFDWLCEPICIMKEQMMSLNLSETEEQYFRKLCLYNRNVASIPPEDPIKRAQLEGSITRRCCFYEVVRAIELEGNWNSGELGSGHEIEVAC